MPDTATAAHVQWCKEERERVREELVAFESGARVVGDPQIGGTGPSQGTLTHILYLKKTIEDLTRVIDSFAPRPPGQFD